MPARLIVNIDVDDLDRAIEFYSRVFDLRLERRLFEDTVAELSGASSPIFLLANPAGTRATPSAPQMRDYRRHWTPVHLDLVVEDVREAVEKATFHRARLEGEIEAYEWGRMARMADPFGHGFCLIEFSGRGYG